MRTIIFILQKEFLQVVRNKMMLPFIFVVPIIQLLILVHAATYEMKHIKVSIVDNDLSHVSRQMVGKIKGSPFFDVRNYTFSLKEAQSELNKDKVDVILNIPAGFEHKLFKENKSTVQILVNAINGTSAGLANAYLIAILGDLNKEIITEYVSLPLGATMPPNIDVEYSFWYNPSLNFKTFMLPGILVLLVTIIALFLTGMNIVREKEIGTIEQINVTPIKKYQFIIGKLLPFLLISLFELAFGLTLGKFMFNIPMLGSLWLIFFFAIIYLTVMLGIGLFISTISDTQQQSMFISWFFMVVFIMMSGLFTSVENMPVWAQNINVINPVAYFIKVMRLVLLKGSGFFDIIHEIIALVIYAIAILSLATWRYQKTS